MTSPAKPGVPANLLAHKMLFLGYRGSVAHGLYTPGGIIGIDDIDLIGVYMGPLNHYLGFGAQDTIERKFEQFDVVHYEIRKFVSLLLKQNPNVLSALWLPEEHIILRSEPWRRLRDHRHLFASRLAYKSFKGYALSQRKKMQRFVEDNPDRDAEIEMLRREIIHRETMAQEVGQGNYARPPYEKWSNKKLRTRLNDLRGTSGYMGEKRRRLVYEHGYDTKNASHLIRLLRMGIEFLDDPEDMAVDRSDRDAETLLEIKRGEWSIEQVLKEADRLMDRLEIARITSSLPEFPDRVIAEHLLMDIISWYYYGGSRSTSLASGMQK